ncbi:MAG: type II secretion system protein GspD [Gemmatimonadetes bacterium]|nr:type II secretion system protein GspD [Gemmatimonadota bacterium]
MRLRPSTIALCLALALRPLHAQQPVKVTDAGIVVDFQDAELSVVLSALAEAGQLNVTFGEVPNRRVTLRLREPVPRGDVLALLKSVAQANGMRVEEEGHLIRLVSVATTVPQTAAPGATAQDAGDVRLFVYRLKHVRAAKLASTLQSIFGGQRAAPATPGLSSLTLTDRLQGSRLNMFGPDTTSRLASPVVLGDAGMRAELKGPVQVVPDETTNALLVRALPADWTIVQEAITAMDLRPLQVWIEVLVAKVRESKDLDVRVSASGLIAPDAKNSTQASTGSVDSASLGAFLLNLTRGGKLSTTAAISALSTRGDVRILSRPLLLAQNNLEAKILVGSQRPFVQVFRTLPTDAGVRDQVVQYRDVGTTLAILPTINADGYVSLQVSQEVSSATAETQFGAPVISTREASTHLFVKDGQTAVLGGLVDRQTEKTRSGIPGLMSLPWVGWIFGSTHNTTTNSELFLFLTPHIVASDEDLERIRNAVDAKSARPDSAQANPPVVPRKPRD